MLEIIRILLLCATGTLLFFLVRVSMTADWRLRTVVLLSFLGRAFLSQLLFWIPYLALPIAPGLQLRDGLWFFAVDSRLYINGAKAAAAGGLDDIVMLTASDPSASYIQFLAFFAYLFGSPLAVSLLLNLFCYAGACAIITRWAESWGTRGARNAALAAIVAISLSPSAILWSMQPLKDTFFQFLIVAFFGACYLWQRAWRADALHKQAWWAGAAIVAVHFLISGVRWYVGFMMLAATVLILPVIALTLHRRRLLGSVAAVAVIVILTRSYLLAAGPYIPMPVKDVLMLRTPFSSGAAPIVGEAEKIRGGFDRLKGNTKIRPVAKPKPAPEPVREEKVAIAEPKPVRAEPVRRETKVAEVAPPPKAEPEAHRATPAELKTAEHRIAEAKSEPAAPAASKPPAPKPAAPKPAAPKAAAPATAVKTAPSTTPSPTHSTPPKPAEPKVAESRPAPAPSTTKVAHTAPPPAPSPKPPVQTAATKPVPEKKAPVKKAPARTEARKEAATKPPAPRDIAPRPATPTPPAVATTTTAPSPTVAAPPAVTEQPTRTEKLLAGAVAAVLPQTISSRLGLVEIGESRGFRWFTEIDTLFFDAFLLLSLISIVIGFRGASPRNGVFWLVLAVTTLMAAGQFYAVTNFGTLFRHRLMIMTGFALIPLALATAPSRRQSAPEPEAAVSEEPAPEGA